MHIRITLPCAVHTTTQMELLWLNYTWQTCEMQKKGSYSGERRGVVGAPFCIYLYEYYYTFQYWVMCETCNFIQLQNNFTILYTRVAKYIHIYAKLVAVAFICHIKSSTVRTAHTEKDTFNHTHKLQI